MALNLDECYDHVMGLVEQAGTVNTIRTHFDNDVMFPWDC